MILALSRLQQTLNKSTSAFQQNEEEKSESLAKDSKLAGDAKIGADHQIFTTGSIS